MNRSLHKNVNTLYLLGFCSSFMVITPIYVPLLMIVAWGIGVKMDERERAAG